MKPIQAFVFSIVHSFFSTALLVLFNFIQLQDILAALASTSYLIWVNTLWSLVFLLVLGGGSQTSIKVFIAPFISSVFTIFTLWILEVQLIDFLTLYILLVLAGILAVGLLFFYVKSFRSE